MGLPRSFNHARYRKSILVIHREHLADRVFSPEIFSSNLTGDYDGKRIRKNGLKITLDQRKGKHLEKVRIDDDGILLVKSLVPVSEEMPAVSRISGRGNNLWEFFLDSWNQRQWYYARGLRRIHRIDPDDTVQIVGVLVEMVIREIIPYPEQDEDAACQTNGETCDVNE